MQNEKLRECAVCLTVYKVSEHEFGKTRKYCSAKCRHRSSSGTVLVDGTPFAYLFTNIGGKTHTLKSILARYEGTGAVLTVKFNT
jgi:hypothetical protein